MKKYNYIPLIVLMIFISSCKKQLDVIDTNQPTLARLNTEAGITQSALGMYGYYDTPDGLQQLGGLLSFNFMWYAMTNHEILGDALFVPWGNEGWRWINRPVSITLDDGTTVPIPDGNSQATEIATFNNRAQGDNNTLKHEWLGCYVINNNANLLLSKINDVTFSVGALVKKKAITAWAYFWKGYAYSRIGSYYSAGVLVNTFSATNDNFITHQVMIDTANSYFDKAISILSAISDSDANFNTIATSVVPAQYFSTALTPSSWIRNINTLKARNILVNNKAKDITNTDWQNILTLASAGIQSTDFIFVLVPDARIINWASAPYSVTENGGFAFASERLVQDFKDTVADSRFHRYFFQLSPPQVNIRSRGIQFGTRWQFIDGTDIASSSPVTTYAKPFIYLGGTYEENELMKAEANIYLGNIDAGLSSVDAVRDVQASGLTHVSGTGLTAVQAKEELRKERRIGLMLRGLAFYDARRWGVIDPVASGGGRKGCWVLDANGNVNTNATFDYQYYNYFPVPTNETDLNAPSSTSAPVTPQ